MKVRKPAGQVLRVHSTMRRIVCQQLITTNFKIRETGITSKDERMRLCKVLVPATRRTYVLKTLCSNHHRTSIKSLTLTLDRKLLQIFLSLSGAN